MFGLGFEPDELHICAYKPYAGRCSETLLLFRAAYTPWDFQGPGPIRSLIIWYHLLSLREKADILEIYFVSGKHVSTSMIAAGKN